MGRTTASITQVFLEEKAAFARFRRALRRQDQLVLDELFADAQQHLAAAGYAAHALPFETFLLAMLLEERKTVHHQQIQLEELFLKLDGMSRQLQEGILPNEND
jgi:hypothetical protein